MALNIAKLQADLILAFKTTLWTDCGNQMGDAIDSFITNGMVITNVNGTVIPPLFPFVPPYFVQGAVGTGQNTMVAPGVATLKATLVSMLNAPSTVWAAVGPIIASAIDTYVKLIFLTTTVTGVLTGTGTGPPGCINTAATIGLLTSELTATFTIQGMASLWDIVALTMASSINSYITGAIVTTTDVGSIPPVSWTGAGVGAIL